MPVNLDAWFDDPAYKTAAGIFSGRGAFILGKLRAVAAARLETVDVARLVKRDYVVSGL